MNTTVTRPSESSESFDATRLWLTHGDRALLLATIRRAAAQARAFGRPIVASYTRSLRLPDPIAVFVAASHIGANDACYWQRPSAGSALVGVGAASVISGQGQGSLEEVAAGWRLLLRDAVCASGDTNETGEEDTQASGQPRCYCGFAFDPLSPRTAQWDGFPDALLILPQVTLSAVGETASLTLNAQVSADDLPEDVVERLIASVVRLRAAVVDDTQGATGDTTEPVGGVALEDLRPAVEWMRLVAETTAAIRRGEYHKVALARATQASAPTTFDLDDALRRLRRDAPTATIFAVRRGDRTFLGATPERLAQVKDGRLRTMALAGTAPRGATPTEDARLGVELTQSAKNREEHAIVVSEIRRDIAPLCVGVSAPNEPDLIRLATLQHLRTPISGELAPGVSALDVVAALHPTPAVGGYPRAAALDAIRRGEAMDRGWYAGPVGWLDAHGDGEFVVALRSALLAGAQATLFAGVGVVADSDPQAEYAETLIKRQVMLRGLGIEA